MDSFHKMHEINTYKEDCPSVYMYLSKTTEQIEINFDTQNLHEKLFCDFLISLIEPLLIKLKLNTISYSENGMYKDTHTCMHKNVVFLFEIFYFLIWRLFNKIQENRFIVQCGICNMINFAIADLYLNIKVNEACKFNIIMRSSTQQSNICDTKDRLVQTES